MAQSQLDRGLFTLILIQCPRGHRPIVLERWMGNFYVNYTVKSTDRRAIAETLRGRHAYISGPHNGCVVVWDEESDQQDPDRITSLGAHLSRTLSCPVLAVLNHDDDILWYRFFERGDVIDTYDSCPSYFDSTREPSGPIGGDAHRLCSAFRCGDAQRIEWVLRRGSFEEDGYLLAYERHADLVSALDLPPWGICFGFSDISHGNLPERIDARDIDAAPKIGSSQ